MNNSSVKVTVIIPVYNSEDYLRDCFASVSGQSLQEIQIIFVDDGSRDSSWSIIKEFAAADTRVVAVKQRNKGVSAARNAGLRIATGEYIGFIDADDYVDKHYFETLYKRALETGADIVSAFVATEDSGRQRFYNHTNKRDVAINKSNLRGVVWLNIYKRSLIEDHQIRFMPKLRTGEDNLFNLEASFYANKIESITNEKVVYHHVAREGSLMTQQYDGRSLLLLSEAILETVKRMNTMEGYEEQIYVNRLIDTLNYFYHRFTESTHLSTRMRYNISLTFVRLWKVVKYRDQVLKEVEENQIDLTKILYGKASLRLFDRYVVRRDERKPKKVQKMARKKKVKNMGLAKKAVKAVLPHGVVVLYKRRLSAMSQVAVSAKKGALDAKKIAVIVPFRNVTYAEMLKQAVTKAGFEAVDTPSDARYIWLHWFENSIENYDDFVSKLALVKTWRDQGRKIIFHVHNKKPHESPVPRISHALTTALLDSADTVAIMSSETKQVIKDMWFDGDDFQRISAVPHPNYINVYGKKLAAPASLRDETLRILFFGLVRPYKGIEHLLEATEGMKHVEISIMGKPKDDAYVAKIMKLCADRDNVNFRLEHIPDEDIPTIFASHHLVALPYSNESSLNSGAALLALSYARTILGTHNGTLKDLESPELYFGYDYNGKADHVRQLKKTLQTIQKKYDGRYNELLTIGEKAYASVATHNSQAVVSSAIKTMIQRLG